MGFIDTLAKSASGALASTPAGLVAGGVGQLFSAMSAARDWKYKQKEMALQQQYNEKNMRLQFDYAREAFDMENEYNDPRNAVARWRAAGIAPQAVYGSSPGGAGVAGSLSTPDSSNPSGSGVDGSAQYAPVMTLGDIQRMENETKVADSQADLNAAKAEEARANAVGQRNENSLFGLTKRLREAQVISAEQQAEQDRLDTRFQTEVFDIQVAIEGEKLLNMAKQREQMNREIAESVSREAVNMMSIREASSRIALNAVQSVLIRTQNAWYGKLSQAQLGKLNQEVTTLAADANLKDAQSIEAFARECNSWANTYRVNEETKKLSRENRLDDHFYNGTFGEVIKGMERAIDLINPLSALRK